jgi:hypothetical protein
MESDPDVARLTLSQRAALACVRNRVRDLEASAHSRVVESLRRAGCDIAAYERAMSVIREHARVVVHFHPDRLGHTPGSVAEALLREGLYRTQFETGRSSGGLAPVTGGVRDSWERALFGGAYQAADAPVSERPKYGALDLVRFSDGPIPRFGSCYFVLRRDVSRRTSFTFAGSEDPRAPERLGTIGCLDAVMAALFEEIEAGGVAAPPWPPFRAPTLGVPDLTVPRILDRMGALATPRPDPANLRPGRVLDTQIEAQVHGPVDLREDVELLVADPSFAQADTGGTLHKLATRYGFPLRWHGGFALRVADVPDDFRGPAMPQLARAIAGDDGVIDAAVIGAAETRLHREPDRWREWGTHAEGLQLLKQLWHVVVHCGKAG